MAAVHFGGAGQHKCSMPSVHFMGAGQYACSTINNKTNPEKLNVFRGFLAHLPGFEPGTFRLGANFAEGAPSAFEFR